MSAAGAARRAWEWLPGGRALSYDDWLPRNRVITRILVAHLPFLVLYALLTRHSPLHAAVDVAPPATLAIVALRARARLIATIASAVGLVTCSAIFVHLSGGLVEWHFHYFVMLALISLYQEWRVYLVTLAFVVLQHALGSLLDFHAVYNHGHGEWWWAAVHGAFVLGASACHITAWRFHEAATARADALHAELVEGEQSLAARLGETAQLRSDLIATASHEFRTPLTVIQGAAATLHRHGMRLSEAEREELLAAIDTRAGRLFEMLESMLIAAQVEPPAANAPDEPVLLAAAVADVLAPLVAWDTWLDIELDERLVVRCPRTPLAQLLGRLVDHARPRGLDDHATLRTGVADGLAFISLRTSAAYRAGIAEPFARSDAASGTDDAGLGLYAARRLAEVHGGAFEIHRDGRYETVLVRLPRAELVPPPRASVASEVTA